MNKSIKISKLALNLSNSNIEKGITNLSLILPKTKNIKFNKHYIPFSKEWSSSIYSFNKNNLILAPQSSQWTYELSKNYLNASSKDKLMNNVFVVRERSKKIFSKIFFNKDYNSQLNNLTEETFEKERDALNIKRMKHMFIFRKNFKLNNNLNRNISKYFSINKTLSKTPSILQKSQHKKRYSVLKTYISKPEIKYNSHSVNITLYMYNKKSMFILKKMKKIFDIIKVKFKNNIEKNKSIKIKLRDQNIQRIKNKFLFKLNNKSNITFFLYMWRHLKVKSLRSLNKDIFSYNKIYNINTLDYTKTLFLSKKIHLILDIFNAKNNNMVNHIFINNKFNKLDEKFNSNLAINKKISLKILLNKYFSMFKLNGKYLKRNITNNILLKSNIFRKLFISLNIQNIKDKLYGFKPLNNLFYFKHTLMSYFFEQYKRNNNNLIALKNIFFKIYSKNIFYNIINLKYWNLDSKILSDVIATKLVDRTKKVLKILKKSVSNKPNFNLVPTILKIKQENNPILFSWKENFFFARNVNNTSILQKNIPNSHILFVSNKYKNNLLLENLQNKWKIGTKLQATGRITKRKTAQRSLSKIKYTGTLKNILSSYGGLSTSLSRGIAKSNLNYTNNNNHSANGSFGLKVSISSLQTLQKWNMNS
jgi:hypothetical protein